MTSYRSHSAPVPALLAAMLLDRDVDAVHTGEPFGTTIQQKLGAAMVVDGGGAPSPGTPPPGTVERTSDHNL